MTDWGAHHNDVAQWALGMDESGPIEVSSTGEEPSKEPNSYNCHPHFEVTYTYEDRKSTRLNSSHANISYAVFCLKKKKMLEHRHGTITDRQFGPARPKHLRRHPS